MMIQLSLAMPSVGAEEAQALARAVEHGEISKGKSVARFEKAFVRLMGGGEAVSVVTGTSAIEVGVRALGLEGKEVVTGAMSCQATANALLASRCTLRFADHDQSSWQVCPKSIEQAITPSTRAIVVAHLYGNAADLDALPSIARAHKVALIEDCSQSLGAKWNSRPVGTFGAVSTFSFYGNKLITTGEGGMMWARDASVAQRARLLRSYGQDEPFHHVAYGLNWKMPNLLAAFGLVQMTRIPELIAARRARAKLLRNLLAGNPDILLPTVVAGLAPAPFCFPIVLPNHEAAPIRNKLMEMGVENRPLFQPQFDQPCWKDCAPVPQGEFPVARWLFKHGLYVSVSPHLSSKQMEIIAERVVKALRWAQRSLRARQAAQAV
jgi:perosamine synthetase